MAISTLQKMRNIYTNAYITLVVGNWNFSAAKRFNLADNYVCFGFFALAIRARRKFGMLCVIDEFTREPW